MSEYTYYSYFHNKLSCICALNNIIKVIILYQCIITVIVELCPDANRPIAQIYLIHSRCPNA